MAAPSPYSFTIREGIRFLWPYLKKYKWNYLSNYIFTFLNSTLYTIIPILFGLLIDEVIYYKNTNFFFRLALIYVVVYLITIFIQIAITLTGRYLMVMLLFDVRLSLFRKIMDAKAEYMTNMKSGNIIQTLDVDTNACNKIITNILDIINFSLQIVLYMSFLLIYNYKFGILMVVSIPIFYLLSKSYGRKITDQAQQQRSAQSNYMSWVYEFLKGLREIRLMAAEKSASISLVKHYKEMIKIKIKSSVTGLKASYGNSLVRLGVNLGTYVMAGVLAYQGEITIGMFVAIMSYFASASSFVDSILRVNLELRGRLYSLKRVANVAELESEEDEERTNELEVTNGEIIMKNVNFSYDDRSTVLENVNLHIRSGEHVAIVGASGAGKSTISALLLGFYYPDYGAVSIDGMDLRYCTLKSIREKIGVVQQEVLVFEGTVRMNLALGDMHASDEEMISACYKAAIGDFITELPDGLDTLIGKDGVDFSGGQKQRLAIARIYLKNPKILIFDEATSALDYESEKLVHTAWDSLTENRTTITIAHRLSTIIKSDRVAVLKNGRIVAFDHHLKLLKDSRFYRDLFEDQYT